MYETQLEGDLEHMLTLSEMLILCSVLCFFGTCCVLEVDNQHLKTQHSTLSGLKKKVCLDEHHLHVGVPVGPLDLRRGDSAACVQTGPRLTVAPDPRASPRGPKKSRC